MLRTKPFIKFRSLIKNSIIHFIDYIVNHKILFTN